MQIQAPNDLHQAEKNCKSILLHRQSASAAAAAADAAASALPAPASAAVDAAAAAAAPVVSSSLREIASTAGETAFITSPRRAASDGD